MDCVTRSITEVLGTKSTAFILGIVMLNPLFWNVVIRLEYYTHFLTRTLGDPKRSVAILAAMIVSFNYVRTSLFHKVMDEHTVCESLQNDYFEAIGYLIILIGATLVISSSYRLGFYCCFMGDYFGIFLNSRVTGFPFNVVSDPMYVGSTLVYLGMALQHASFIGVMLTTSIGLSYALASLFEGPFTAKIYANKKRMESAAKSE